MDPARRKRFRADPSDGEKRNRGSLGSIRTCNSSVSGFDFKTIGRCSTVALGSGWRTRRLMTHLSSLRRAPALQESSQNHTSAATLTRLRQACACLHCGYNGVLGPNGPRIEVKQLILRCAPIIPVRQLDRSSRRVGSPTSASVWTCRPV
jgi:hypothetical protein